MSYGSNPKPKGPAPNIPRESSKPGRLTVQIKMTETNKFKNMAELVSDMLKDRRVEVSIRQEYVNRFEEINNK